MATLPLWVIGSGITSVVMTPQTVNSSTGVMADTTPVQTYSTVWKEIAQRSENELQDISASDQRRKNMVPVATSTHITCSEVLQVARRDSQPINAGAGAGFGAGDYFKFAFTRAAKTFTFYGVLESYEERTNGKGEVTGEIALAMVDPGAANPTYA